MKTKTCRNCKAKLEYPLAHLGMSPLSNSYVKPDQIQAPEAFYPLNVYVCQECLLVQAEEFESPKFIFGGEYAYFSSYSSSWLKHVKEYSQAMTEKFKLGTESLVVEVASNDGYALQYFKENNIPVLGIEPALNVAEIARSKGIQTITEFFGVKLAKTLASDGKKADLLFGKNVLAHVPKINDFVAGLKLLLKEDGVITIEFPHLLQLINNNQFDTIYHEHFSYLCLLTVEKIFDNHGLTVFDVEEWPTHGGSLRIFARHKNDTSRAISPNVDRVKKTEIDGGLRKMETYLNFSEQVKETKRKILAFMIEAKRAKKTVVGYGAPAKGNTLLNYCGIKTDFIDYTVDISPHKAGNLLPGSRIPVEKPSKIFETKPDYVFILPWNLKDEIMEQMKGIREWGGKFVVPIPEIKVY